MTRLRTFNFDTMAPYGIGLDTFFEDAHRLVNQATTSYPPYNILRNEEGDKFRIEMALAGVSMDDLKITVADDILTITYGPAIEENSNDKWTYAHKGVAQRKFERKLKLMPEIVVQAASMENGMLYIDLERIIPEEKKPRLIQIEHKS